MYLYHLQPTLPKRQLISCLLSPSAQKPTTCRRARSPHQRRRPKSRRQVQAKMHLPLRHPRARMSESVILRSLSSCSISVTHFPRLGVHQLVINTTIYTCM